jgi:hypothetical protein
LLDTLDGLARLEARLDNLEVVLFIRTGSLGDLVDHRGQVRMQNAEAHGVGTCGAHDGRRGNDRRRRD